MGKLKSRNHKILYTNKFKTKKINNKNNKNKLIGGAFGMSLLSINLFKTINNFVYHHTRDTRAYIEENINFFNNDCYSDGSTSAEDNYKGLNKYLDEFEEVHNPGSIYKKLYDETSKDGDNDIQQKVIIKKNIIKNNLYGFDNIKKSALVFACTHGSHYDTYTVPFIVPKNIVICIVGPLFYNTIINSDEKFLYKLKYNQEDKIKLKKLYDSLFKYKQNIDSEKLRCKTEKFRNHYKEFKTNYFKQSTWFYPGQKCNQMMLGFSEREYKIVKNKHIYSVSYNEGINYNITDFKGIKGEDTIEDILKKNGPYRIELEKLCIDVQENDKKKIIIVSGCRSCHGEPDIFREFKYRDFIVQCFNRQIGFEILQNTHNLTESQVETELENVTDFITDFSSITITKGSITRDMDDYNQVLIVKEAIINPIYHDNCAQRSHIIYNEIYKKIMIGDKITLDEDTFIKQLSVKNLFHLLNKLFTDINYNELKNDSEKKQVIKFIKDRFDFLLDKFKKLFHKYLTIFDIQNDFLNDESTINKYNLDTSDMEIDNFEYVENITINIVENLQLINDLYKKIAGGDKIKTFSLSIPSKTLIITSKINDISYIDISSIEYLDLYGDTKSYFNILDLNFLNNCKPKFMKFYNFEFTNGYINIIKDYDHTNCKSLLDTSLSEFRNSINSIFFNKCIFNGVFNFEYFENVKFVYFNNIQPSNENNIILKIDKQIKFIFEEIQHYIQISCEDDDSYDNIIELEFNINEHQPESFERYVRFIKKCKNLKHLNLSNSNPGYSYDFSFILDLKKVKYLIISNGTLNLDFLQKNTEDEKFKYMFEHLEITFNDITNNFELEKVMDEKFEKLKKKYKTLKKKYEFY